MVIRHSPGFPWTKAAMAPHVAQRSPTIHAPAAPVFDMPDPDDLAAMLRVDLTEARRAWLKEAKHNPEEYARREQSDFLAVKNHDGEHLDFHALRHTCGAWLSMTGAHPKAVQTIMRHSSITLTMDTYGHLFPGQEADSVARLCDLFPAGPQSYAATGTDDARPKNLGPHSERAGRETVQSGANASDAEGHDQQRAPRGKRSTERHSSCEVMRSDAAPRIAILKAEGRGFELPIPCGTPDFESGGNNENPRENEAFQKSGAPQAPRSAANTPEADPNLLAVAEAWPTLPAAIKAGILAMVKSAVGQ